MNESAENYIKTIYVLKKKLKSVRSIGIATIIFLVFFFVTAIVQIRAFAKGHTPLPKWCWIFNILFGVV